MKHIIISLLFFCPALAHAAEVVVYSPKSDKSLHVSRMDANMNPVDPATFPQSHTGHRSVCIVAGATNDNYCAWTGSAAYNPMGDVFGTSNGGLHPSITLTPMSAITPRFDMTAREKCDRTFWTGYKPAETNRFTETLMTERKTHVRVVRYKVDGVDVYRAGTDADVVMERDYDSDVRTCLHEGDFLQNGALDIDWANLYSDVVMGVGMQMYGCEVTNVEYTVVFGYGKASYNTDLDTNSVVTAHPITINRRFELNRSIPFAVRTDYPQFYFDYHEDSWTREYGTTYTAFRLKVFPSGSTNIVYDTGVTRMPGRMEGSPLRWTMPSVLSPGEYQWRVAVYNAKFKTDELWNTFKDDDIEKVFSQPVTFTVE